MLVIEKQRNYDSFFTTLGTFIVYKVSFLVTVTVNPLY